MEELKGRIYDAAAEEPERASERYGLFNSTHEAYAVTIEEFEELAAEVNKLGDAMRGLWDMVKHNASREELSDVVSFIRDTAAAAGAETTQVVAMAVKWSTSDLTENYSSRGE